MKKIITGIIATVVLITTVAANFIYSTASDTMKKGYCGENAIWSLDTSTGILTISGTGDMYKNYRIDSWGYHKYRDEIKKVIIEEGITSIGDFAFAKTSLSGDLILPKSLKNIGSFAFCYTDITSVNLSEGMYLGGQSFRNCNLLKEVTIPKDLIYIMTPTSNAGRPNAAFYYCESLEKVIIKGGGKIDAYTDRGNNGIGESLFNYCTFLKEIIIDSRDIEYVDSVTYNAEGRQDEGTFWLENNPTFYIYKDSTTEQTLKDAGYLTDENTVYIAEFSALKTAIAEAEETDTNGYTDESVSDFNKALENGRAVLEDLTSSQDDVDNAVNAIKNATKALTKKTSSNTTVKKPSNTTTTPRAITTTAKKATKPAKVSKVKLKAKKKKLSVSWKKVSGAKGYEVVWALNKKFTKSKKRVRVKKNKATLKKLKSKKKYYVKVRAYKIANGKRLYGKWSKVVKKKVK